MEINVGLWRKQDFEKTLKIVLDILFYFICLFPVVITNFFHVLY